MVSKTTKTGDDGNMGFGSSANLVDHKPGFDRGAPARERETRGNHRFRRSDQKDIPQGSLADRVAKSKKGK
jgi:hypothetical protein